MTLALEDRWIWDSWYAHDGERWHAYFLQAPKSIGDPELRHWNVSYGHATSVDLVNWTQLGTCFEPAAEESWDDYTTWTGSVMQHDGLWHLFYTGSRRSEDGLYQRLGHATSTDMHHWTRVGNGLCLDIEGPNAVAYEADHATSAWHDRAMRDPWVMKDPDSDEWLMYFTARSSAATEPNDGGAIGFATSRDLVNWTLQPPVFSGGYGQLEVPQVFEHQGRWYCLFSTSAEHFSKAQAESIPGGPVTGTHYLQGDGPRGPWRIPQGRFLDGDLPCRRYASRILETPQGLVILGFADRPEGADFYGYVMDPEPVDVLPDGTLRLRQAVRSAR